MKFHPIANIFPLLQGKAFDELCEDVKANGLREPIWLYEGMILDGRNRYRACEVISYAPEYRTYEGDDPYSFVGSLNVHRRHLTQMQRGMIVADLVTAKTGGQRGSAITAAQAGALVGVSPNVVRAARAIKMRGTPELISAAVRGDFSARAGNQIASLMPDKQKLVINRMLASKSGQASNENLDTILQDVAPGAARTSTIPFTRDLDEMAVRILDFFTAPQIDILWDIIAKKQSEMIAARKEKAS